MAFRLPQTISVLRRVKTGENVLDAEIIAEQAASLANAARSVETSLQQLALVELDGEGQDVLIQRAADAVFGYFVQRELCGYLDHNDAIAHYKIPKRVLARVGAK